MMIIGSHTMRKLGNKNEAKKLARVAKVPLVPGSEGLITTEEDIDVLNAALAAHR